ncbi:MAG: DUF2148 domain-containing protein [Methanomicrobiales archaeon]
MTAETEAIRTVACLMVLSARTAPKARGVDEIKTRIVSEIELKQLADEMVTIGEKSSIPFFIRDGKCMALSDACVLIGVRGGVPVGVNCQGCGLISCDDFQETFTQKKPSSTPFSGPNCIIRIADLGIAVGSAVKTAQVHNVDNRIMYSAGVAARSLGWLNDCTSVYGIPLKGSGKNIFFDR